MSRGGDIGERSASGWRLRWPFVGLAVGSGLFTAECLVVLSGVMESFGGTGVWRQMVLWFLVYAATGAVLDLLAQLVLPRGWRWTPLLRGLPMLLLGTAALVAFGTASTLPATVVPLAIIWAACLHVRWGIPLVVGWALWAFMPAFPTAAPPPPAEMAATVGSGPSFVVVVLDTARRDRFSTYGYPRETTPNVDALAERGVRFDRAYSTSCWSVPSHASLFTGLFPINHGAHFEHVYLDGSFDTIAGLLSERGYETAGFSPNPYVATGTGMSHGFHTFTEIWRPLVFRRFLVAGHMYDRLRSASRDKGGAGILEEIRDWADRRDPDRPYFLFVNVLEAHAPYHDVPARFFDEFVDADRADIQRVGDESHEAQWTGTRVDPGDREVLGQLVDAATAAADHYLGEILEVLGGDPVVVVVSDHGDLIGEHELYGHMTSLYEPLIRIPFVMAGPGIEAGVVTDPVSLADVMPTLMAMAGVEVDVDGADLGPLMSGETSRPDRIIPAWHYDTSISTVAWSLNRSQREMRSIRARRAATIAGNVKRVVSADGTDFGFDLSADPAEVQPFPGDRTQLVAVVPDPGEVPEFNVEDLDPAQLEALRALGYIQ